MSKTSFEKIGLLLKDSESLGKATEKYKEATQPSSVDKYGFKFKQGNSDRFNCFSLNAYLESYTGSFGSSSCYTLFSLYSGEVNTVFAEYLNDNKEVILQELSTRLKNKAKELLSEAESEVGVMQETLNKLKEG